MLRAQYFPVLITQHDNVSTVCCWTVTRQTDMKAEDKLKWKVEFVHFIKNTPFFTGSFTVALWVDHNGIVGEHNSIMDNDNSIMDALPSPPPWLHS